MADVAGGKVPVLDCFKASWTFLFQHWQMFLPAALVVGAVGGLSAALMPATGGTAANPAMGALLLSSLPSMIAGVMFTAAVLRKAVRDEFAGPAGLGLGQDEMRLLGVLGSLVLLVFPVVFLALIIFGIYLAGRLGAAGVEALPSGPEGMQALQDAIGPEGVLLMSVLFLLAAALLIYVLAKLFMANAATIGERKFVFLQTWAWSKGNTHRVILAVLLTSLPAFGVNYVLQGAAVALSGEGASPIVAVAATGVMAFVATMLNIPQIALGAQLYKGLRPPGFVAK